MATKTKTSIAAQLNSTQLAIANSLADAEILGLVSTFGYTEAKLNAGRALYETAQRAVNSSTALSGAQQAATQELKEVKKTAHDAYQALAKVARAVFSSDKAALVTLGLTGVMPKSIAGFLAAAYLLFDNAQSLTALGDFGYYAAKLTAERARITALDVSYQRRESAKGAAQQAVREQESALKALNDWHAQYRQIARVALRGKPQLLEKIGIVARTSPTRAQADAKRNKLAADG